MRRGAPLLALAVAACGAGAADPDRAAVARAAAYLWDQQAADGGWHSDTYGLLRSGQSLTPFVLATLSSLPPDLFDARPEAVARAVAFIAERVDDNGCLGLQDALLPDYPNYATALAVEALRAAGQRDDLVQRMEAYLRDQQFAEVRGWTPDHPAHGGWGMGGAPREAPHHGHLDLSMSRHVMEALAAAPADDVTVRALRFLARCQNADGGFLFSPAIDGANKAGRTERGFRSYGSTTADGVLSLLAMGVRPDDPRVVRAREWLVAHHRVDRVPGFPADEKGGWSTGLHFYYLAASSRALRQLGAAEAPAGRDWRDATADALAQLQADDGSWTNWNSLVKEDDPLIATVLALQALTATLGDR